MSKGKKKTIPMGEIQQANNSEDVNDKKVDKDPNYKAKILITNLKRKSMELLENSIQEKLNPFSKTNMKDIRRPVF